MDESRPNETDRRLDPTLEDEGPTSDVDAELPAATGLGDLGAPADDPAPGGADAPEASGIGTFGGGGTLGMPGGVGLPNEGDRRP